MTAEAKFELYVMNTDGGRLRRLTRKRENAFPAWSLDGRKIAFVSNRDGNLELYVAWSSTWRAPTAAGSRG